MTNRRAFIKSTSLSAVPFLFNINSRDGKTSDTKSENSEAINFVSDGELLTPEAYAERLKSVVTENKQSGDFYGQGGAVAALEQEFAAITGKEKAVFLPSGTMANQLAIKLLSGDNTKVFVQETSHVYRDEADAAQSVHHKRLIPLAKGTATFTLEELKESIDYHNRGEVFKSGIGAISIENPVRRADGQVFDFEEIKKISSFCRGNNYKLHLDGARLHIASSYSGISVKEYAGYFDTVYISLYKYLGSAGGAILCGDSKIIDQIPHLIKIYGGNTFQSWPYAAMALAHLKGVDQRLAETKKKAEEFIAAINKTKEFRIEPIVNGTNVFNFSFQNQVDIKKFNENLYSEKIMMGRPNATGTIKFLINETILKKDVPQIIAALQESFSKAKAN